jgi:hypothetical protein
MTVPTLGPVTKLLHAANSHPTGDFLAIFAHDGVVDDWGREYIGRGAIKEWSDREFIGAKVSLSVIKTTTISDNELQISAEVGGDGYTGPSTATTSSAQGPAGQNPVSRRTAGGPGESAGESGAPAA